MTAFIIHRVERIAIVFVAVATLLSLLFWPRAVFLGVATGGGLAAVNFYALRRILQGILQASGRNPAKQVMLAVLLTLKFGVLAACLFLIVKYVAVDPVAFMVGISLVVLAIFIEGFCSVFRRTAAQPE